MALRIERRSGERIQLRVGDVVAWIRVEQDGSRIAVVVDGDPRLRVLREELVPEADRPDPASGYDYGPEWGEDV